jgi:5-methylcytosine-specific restriction endonuclease McrA
LIQDGRQKTCGPVCAKAAEKARVLRYRTRNAEKVAALRSKSYAKWASANQEHLRAKRAAWRAEHPEYQQAWRLQNLEHVRALKADYQRKRRAKLRNGGTYRVTPRDRSRLMEKHHNRCAYCQQEFSQANPLQWDHVVPLARGGVDSIGNLLPACRRCNQSKGDRFLAVWRGRNLG